MKNLLLISKDLKLFEALTEIDGLNMKNSTEIAEGVLIGSDIQYVIVSDQIIGFNDLIKLSERYPIKRVVYMISDRLEASYRSILESHNIHVIAAKRTVKQVVDAICEIVFDSDRNKAPLVAIYGADSKTGTTQIAQCIASQLADNSELSVCLIHANKRFSDTYTGKNISVSGIDDLKADIMNKMITLDTLKSNVNKIGNLDVLYGLKYYPNRKMYAKEHAEYLFDILTTHYDLVIADVGSDIDLAFSYQALIQSGFNILVTTPSVGVLDHYKTIREHYLRPLDIADFALVFNKFVDNNSVMAPSDACDEYEAVSFGVLPDIGYGLDAEINGKLLTEYGNKEFNDGITRMSKVIAKRFGFEVDEPENKRFTFTKWFGRKERISG